MEERTWRGQLTPLRSCIHCGHSGGEGKRKDRSLEPLMGWGALWTQRCTLRVALDSADASQGEGHWAQGAPLTVKWDSGELGAGVESQGLFSWDLNEMMQAWGWQCWDNWGWRASPGNEAVCTGRL